MVHCIIKARQCLQKIQKPYFSTKVPGISPEAPNAKSTPNGAILNILGPIQPTKVVNLALQYISAPGIRTILAL